AQRCARAACARRTAPRVRRRGRHHREGALQDSLGSARVRDGRRRSRRQRPHVLGTRPGDRMTPASLLAFMRRYRVAVQASVSATSAAQAAVVGIAVTDRFEIVFDTLSTSRKAQNLRRNPKIALVFGGMVDGEERTAQYEGLADEPTGDELE